MKYAFIKRETTHEVRKLCRTLQVSPSGYYAWAKRRISNRVKANNELLAQIECIHKESRQLYGTIKTWEQLRRRGVACGRHRVARLRRIHGIQSKRKKRFKTATTDSRLPNRWICPNHLNRNFGTSGPNKVWVADVTFIATRRGCLYLAVILDLYSRRVIGWSMSSTLNKTLVIGALDMALLTRKPFWELLHHTDRGSVYASDEYQNRLSAYGLLPSMSRKANCYDNAVAESFFSTLKNELMFGRAFESVHEARFKIFEYLEVFYNKQRLHQSLNYLTPEEADRSTVS